MSLTRQTALLLVGALWLAILCSLGVHAVGLQDALRLQQEVRNRDDASLLALALSQQGGDATLMQTVAAATFDLGHYRRLTLRGPDSRILFDMQEEPRSGRAPGWLVRVLPIATPPGTAEVTDGWRPVARLEVSAHSAWAHESLWSTLQSTAVVFVVLGALVALVAAALLRAWQRPLQVTVAQARALEEGRFVLAEEPRAPELRRLTRAMNSMVRRLQQWFDVQAAQVDALQRQAQTDTVTGLSNRRHFLGRLETAQREHPDSVGALLMLRIQDLQGLNQRLGHAGADRLLAAVAEVLAAVPTRFEGATAGRLNGSDFALMLPAAGAAAETAASLVDTLRRLPPAVAAGLNVVAGGVDDIRTMALPAVLATADAALAQAEATGPYAVEVRTGQADATVVAGAHAWHQRIARALEEGRVHLDERPVRDRDGRLLFLACPLRLQLDPGGDHRPASYWLALAGRSQLLPRIDLCAVELALQAIARDGRDRCVHVAAASVGEVGFIDRVRSILQRDPTHARRLLLEVAEPTSEPLVGELREAADAWQAVGARVGLEDAGGTLQGRHWLQSLRLHHVRVGGAAVAGLAGDEAVGRYASSLVLLVHGLGLQLVAGEVDDPADLDALWPIGFDGAAGAAVPPEPGG